MDQDKKLSHDEIWDVCSINESTAPNSLLEEVGCTVLDDAKPNDCKNSTTISTIAFSNSSDIQIGDRIIYNGPVTITRDAVDKKCNLKFKILSVVLIILVTSAIVVSVIFTRKSFSTTENKEQFEPKIISREEWGAQPPDPDNQGGPLELPLNKTIINHTVGRNCYTQECCSQIMREFQDDHLKRQWGDIGYSFVVCNDGNVYEGVGWDIQGAHTRGQNRISFGIAYNGNFNNEIPNPKMIAAGFWLMDEGVRLGKLTKDYKIYGFRQFRDSDSPGDAFYQVIQTWDRWTDEI